MKKILLTVSALVLISQMGVAQADESCLRPIVGHWNCMLTSEDGGDSYSTILVIKASPRDAQTYLIGGRPKAFGSDRNIKFTVSKADGISTPLVQIDAKGDDVTDCLNPMDLQTSCNGSNVVQEYFSNVYAHKRIIRQEFSLSSGHLQVETIISENGPGSDSAPFPIKTVEKCVK